MEWHPPEYDQVLKELITQNEGIDGAAIITVDGVYIASVLPKTVSPQQASFLSVAVACAMSLATLLVEELGKGDLSMFYTFGPQTYVVAMPLLPDLLIIALCNEKAQIDLIHLDLGRTGGFPLLPATDPIIPPRPPGSLNAHATPDYDALDG